MSPHTCLKIEAAVVEFGNGIGNGKAAQAIAARHDGWARRLPKSITDLWDWVLAQDSETRLSLLAYCAARSINAVRQPWNNEPKRLAHADKLVSALSLDMADYWSPTAESYLGRVTKARILEAVREGVSERDAESLANLKKPEMASHAELLLAGTRWLPAVLRTPELPSGADGETAAAISAAAE